MYTLYTIPGSCSTGIHVLLNKLNIDVEIVNRSDVENYQEIVPTNQVPALATPEGVITEGAAIVLYLIDKHDLNIEKYAAKGEFYQWLMFNYATLHPAYSKLFTINGIVDDAAHKHEVLAKLAVKTAYLWKIVDVRLSQSSYIFGDIPTVIDYLIALYVGWGNNFASLDIPVGENTLKMVEKVVKLPEFVKAMAVEEHSYNVPKNALAA